MWRWRRRSDADFAEEIRGNIALETDRLIAGGMDARAARLAAQKAFGNVALAQERFYESSRLMWLDDLARDARYALRSLRRNPGFAAIVILTLAVGIGAGTIVYSFARAVLLRPLPYSQPQDLVRIFETNPLKGWTRNIASPANYADWRARNRVFSDIAAYESFPGTLFLSHEGDAQPLKSLGVTGNLFRVLGAEPLLGRVFTDEETFEGKGRVAVLSYGTWRQLFAGDQGIVGRSVVLSGVSYEVAGVMPGSFFFPGRDIQIWRPVNYSPNIFTTSRRPHSLNVVARRKVGVSLDQARLDMAAIAGGLEREYPDTNTQMGVRLEAFHDSLAAEPRPAIVMLSVAVGVLFLIVCTNVASLQFGRSIARAREFETRRALGAGRGRLIRQLVTESLTLSALGGACGVGLAALTRPALVRLAASGVPSFADVRLDGSVLLFALLLAFVAPLICGVIPALVYSRATAMNARGASASRRATWLRSTLVGAETGLSIVLVVGSILLVRSVLQLADVDPGFNPDRVVTFTLTLPSPRYPTPQSWLATFGEIEARIREQPGIESAGASTSIALQGFTWTGDATVEGRAPADYERELRHASVTPGYFKTMGIRLDAGRPFDDRDRIGQPPTTIVNEALVRKYLRGADPLAARIRFGRPQDTGPWVQIVGVVADARQDGLDRPALPMAYVTIAQQMIQPLTFVVRTPLAPESAIAAIRQQVRALDSGLALTSVATMQDVVADSLGAYRFRTTLLTSFAAIALLLAALGTYGTLAYVVSQRSRELGIRLALGAPRMSLFRQVIAQGMRPVVAGGVAGVAGALALTGLMSSLLFGVTALDPPTYASAAALLLAIGVGACAAPAWRAIRVDPSIVLRCD